ncbi:MAG: phasin family protein [Kiloniellaceae bacterium]
MATKKTPTKTATKKPAAAAVTAKATKPVETTAAASKETMEAVVKVGTQAATKSYEQAVSMAQEQVDKASTNLFKSYDDVANHGKDTVDAYVESSTVFAKGIEALSKELMGFTQSAVEANIAATKALFGAKTVNEVIDLQNEFSRTRFDSLVSESAKLTELSMSLANDAFEPIQLRVNATVEKMMKPIAA